MTTEDMKEQIGKLNYKLLDRVMTLTGHFLLAGEDLHPFLF
jgi:hypothetical protein